MMEHLMVFAQDSEMWCHSTGDRDQGSYEQDLVRLEYDLDKLDKCRLCYSQNIIEILDFGETALANAFLEHPDDPEIFAPLQVYPMPGLRLGTTCPHRRS